MAVHTGAYAQEPTPVVPQLVSRGAAALPRTERPAELMAPSGLLVARVLAGRDGWSGRDGGLVIRHLDGRGGPAEGSQL